MARWSIRRRVAALATILFALVLAVAAVLVVSVQRRVAIGELDGALERRSDLVLDDLGARAVDAGGPPVLITGTNDEDQFAQLVVDGRVVAATPNLAGEGPLALPAPSGSRTVADAEGLPVEDDDYRVLTRWVEIGGRRALLHIGENTDDLHDLDRALVRTFLVAVPVLAATLGIAVWFLVGRALRPVEAIRAEVADIGGDDLHRRVPEPTTGDEVARLAVTMNAMLERLQRATDLQRQFVADASHELRSPLTRIRAEVDVALAQGDAGASDDALRSVRADAEELGDLVADLLTLARLDAGPDARRRVPLDLDALVADEVHQARAAGAVVDLIVNEPIVLDGDRPQLVRAVRNLLDNGRRHALERVEVSLRRAVDGHGGAVAVLVVDDDGSGVAPPDRERIFERFARGDDARSRGDGGTGLGLAIVREVAVAHGGSARVTSSPTGGASFILVLPLAP